MVLITLGVIAYVAFVSDQSNSEVEEQKIRELSLNNDKKAFEGDADGALKAYDEAIASQSDDTLKANLLIKKSALAFSNDRKEVALESAQTAYDLEVNLGTASTLAQLYDKKGEKEKAIEYYKKAVDLIDTEADPESSMDESFFKRRIAELEAGR